MRVTLVTDAWAPQVNGVVRTLSTVMDIATARGHHVQVISPDRFRSLPMPGYGEIRLALTTRRTVARTIADFAPDAVHIATEGPLGWLARSLCTAHGVAFTTSFHTRFPDYVAARTGMSPALIWRIIKRFHQPAKSILVATPRLAEELAGHGLPHTRPWTRGVDLLQFSPARTPHSAFASLERPIALHVGRVAVEKNIEAFLAADWPGAKVIVGDGPARASLAARYPDALFLGALHGDALASAYAGADVLAFPSRTDTFGLVIIEALACGTPVAGYPVPGPLDILGADGLGRIGYGVSGALSGRPVGAVDEGLATAMHAALDADRDECAAFGARFSWDHACDQFLASLTDTEAPPEALAA
ncbi:GDP-mannose-dependent alpha-mannosyltransferase [Polymorphobacter multimanifer]|uniref:glycosyltransferase family 4 protein n=1 Tax=Polymorphobacter multimanifer TaxID=1070431 RepID=UPI00166686FB|nr:glycosyltransferase family 1 protein [Polymorphobacter multimanifer]GGI68431.1 GDP-mannose-dependent alpha-mannosyltransferase [Polymorphobacter multimanifer]